MHVSLVPIDHLDDVWGVVAPMLDTAVAVTHGRYTTDDVRQLLLADRMSLWIAFDDEGICGCEVTQIIDYPSKRCLCSMFTAGRRLRDWRDPMMGLLLRFAREVHCTAIEGQGRAAWVKMLEPWGARQIAVLYEKEI
jgi:hypothetical protein